MLRTNVCDGNEIEIDESKLDDRLTISISVKGSNNKVLIKEGLFGRGNLAITIVASNCTIEIKKVHIKKNLVVSLPPAGGGGSTSNCNVMLGDGTIYNGTVSLLLSEINNSIVIGKNCLLANNIRLSTSDSHTIYDKCSGIRLNPAASISIDDHCWICNDVVIYKNSHIPKNSVVASNSLVNKRFDGEGFVLGGIPAKILRNNINWDIKARY